MAGERDGRIRFYCEHCREAVSAPGDKAGKKGECPKCNRLMAIPAASTRQPGERHPEQGRPFPRPKPKVEDTREPIRFFCEHCRAAVSAPADKGGKMGHCPKCDGLMDIPKQSTRTHGQKEPGADAADAAPAAPQAAPPAKVDGKAPPQLAPAAPVAMTAHTVACPFCGAANATANAAAGTLRCHKCGEEFLNYDASAEQPATLAPKARPDEPLGQAVPKLDAETVNSWKAVFRGKSDAPAGGAK